MSDTFGETMEKLASALPTKTERLVPEIPAAKDVEDSGPQPAKRTSSGIGKGIESAAVGLWLLVVGTAAGVTLVVSIAGYLTLADVLLAALAGCLGGVAKAIRRFEPEPYHSAEGFAYLSLPLLGGIAGVMAWTLTPDAVGAAVYVAAFVAGLKHEEVIARAESMWSQ